LLLFWQNIRDVSWICWRFFFWFKLII
jgi:hypothetical protein